MLDTSRWVAGCDSLVISRDTSSDNRVPSYCYTPRSSGISGPISRGPQLYSRSIASIRWEWVMDEENFGFQCSVAVTRRFRQALPP